jgi:hypothetical protein
VVKTDQRRANSRRFSLLQQRRRFSPNGVGSQRQNEVDRSLRAATINVCADRSILLKLLVGLIGILRSTGSKSANGLLLKPGKKLLSRQKGISRSLRIEDSAFITRSDQINLKIALERHSASHHLTTKKAGSNAPFVRRNTQPKEKRMTIDNSRRSAPLGLGALAVGTAAVALVARAPPRPMRSSRLAPGSLLS